jgi:hypothetical protein
LHRALGRRECRIYVLRLDETRPVWPSLRSRGDWKDKWLEAYPNKGEAEDDPDLLQRIRREKIANSLKDLLQKLGGAPVAAR